MIVVGGKKKVVVEFVVLFYGVPFFSPIQSILEKMLFD
jgi:hypothetical protein